MNTKVSVEAIENSDPNTLIGFDESGIPREYPMSHTRNKLLNGNFRYSGNGTSFTPSLGDETLNGWDFSGELDGGSLTDNTVERQDFSIGHTDVPGNPDHFARINGRLTGTSGAGHVTFEQKIGKVQRLSGQTVTVSFYAKAASSRDIGIDIEQYFGSGGSPSAAVITNGDVVTLTTSWTKYEVTIDIPSVSGKILGSDGNDYISLEIVLFADSGSDNTTVAGSSTDVDIANIQLEEGSYSSQFQEHSDDRTLGINQKWRTLSGGSVNVTYTNTTNKPILVHGKNTKPGGALSQASLRLLLDGTEISRYNSVSDATTYVTCTGIVPAGSTFRFEYGAGNTGSLTYIKQLK